MLPMKSSHSSFETVGSNVEITEVVVGNTHETVEAHGFSTILASLRPQDLLGAPNPSLYSCR